MPLLVVLLGPTASGKTALSMRLAGEFGGEIVSCDSVAVYRGLEIGSAKPSREQRDQVPHHLIDVASIEEPYTAGDYSRAARSAIAGIVQRGRLPIVTGGSGLYLRALLAGLFAGPKRSDELRRRLRQKAEDRGTAYVHRILARLDPVSAARIHANDLPKVVRAIEVSLATAQPLSKAFETGRDPLIGYRVLRIGLDPDRGRLYLRINLRARQMFADGLVEETRDLLARQSEHSHALRSLGYRQAADYLRGMLTLEQAIGAAGQGHRNYSKRQLTWFRREPAVNWLPGFGDDPAIAHEAARLVSSHIHDP